MFGRPGRRERSRKPRVQRSREERLKRIKRAENRMLGLAAAMCVAIGGAGWVYKRNNAIPDLVVSETARPVRNGYDLVVSAAEQSTSALRQQLPVDAVVSSSSSGLDLELDSPEYEWRYPLARQSKYLQSNKETLRLLRQGLALPYVQPPQVGESWISGFRVYDLRDLLAVEARVRARRHDWDGAARSLRDRLRLSYAMARGAGVNASVYGASFRKRARLEFDWLWPHLSGQQLRGLALQLEAMHQARVPMHQALEEEKRANQRFLLQLMRIGDLRILYGYSSPDSRSLGPSENPPKPPPLEQLVAQNQPEFDSLPRLVQLRLAWMSKPSILREHARCMDWQIARAKLPYVSQTRQWPFPPDAWDKSGSDALRSATYPRFTYTVRNTLKSDALDTLSFVSLALRAFHAEHKYLPRRLSELVPRYLAHVPRDPFDPSRTLGYKPQPIHASWSERRPRIVQPPPRVVVTARGLATPTPYPGSISASPPGSPTPTPVLIAQGPPGLVGTGATPLAPTNGPAPDAAPPQLAPSDETHELIVHPLGAPWTLWSIGPDGRDNNGLPFRYTRSRDTNKTQFSTGSMYEDDTTQSDIVAGINY